MAVPGYARRIARLPEVFEELMAHPAGLPLTDLAARFGVPVDELREDLLAFFTADVGLLLGLSRPPVLEFVGADGDEDDPNDAEVVRIVDERPADELGVEYVDASELALIYTSARALLEIDPDDKDLSGAVDVLTETMFGTPLPQGTVRSWQRPLEPLQDAVQARRRVRIVYSRSWHAGVTDRVIEPYRLVQTRRGWEVDAGPVDDSGAIRTYLLSNIRDFEVLDGSFVAPAELPRLLDEQRTTERVRVRIPHHARWAADMYAEQVIVAQDDEETVTLDLHLLPPLEQRLGLLLLASGPDAAVVEPAELVRTVRAVAGELLAHHREA
jgi:hypothetical protein